MAVLMVLSVVAVGAAGADCHCEDDVEIDADKIGLTAIDVNSNADEATFRITNDNETDVDVTWNNYDDEDVNGTVTATANDTTYFTVDAEDGEATVQLFYEGEQIDVKASHTADDRADEIDTDEIQLVPMHSNTVEDWSVFEIRNGNDQNVYVDFEIYGVTTIEDVKAPANGTGTFTADGADITTAIHFQDEQIDVKHSNTVDDRAVDDLRLVAIDTDSDADEATFRVDNMNDGEATTTVSIYGTDVAEDVTVDAESSTSVTLEADNGSATAILEYDGEQIDQKASNTERDYAHLDLVATGVDEDADLAQFRIDNHNAQEMTVEVSPYGDDATQEITIEGNSTTYFTVDAEDGEVTLQLFNGDDELETTASNTQVDLDLGDDEGEDEADC